MHVQHILVVVLFASVCGTVRTSQQTSGTPSSINTTNAIYDLIDRVLEWDQGASKRFFQVQVIPKVDGKDVMQLSSAKNFVVLRGSGGVELASAFGWYLNEYLNITYDWNTYAAGQLPPLPPPPSDLSLSVPSSTANTRLLKKLPLPPTSPLRVRQVPYSYYMNVCTYGYSLAFVPWEYWVKHIDWMAVNGINLPLAFVGQEWIWVKTFAEFNITVSELQEFFSGPAFLPWFRMGNMQGWGGPITENWLERRYYLGLQILARMRSLGMKPVLGAFAGHVPDAFVKKYPQANVTRSPRWGNFPDPYGSVYMLQPQDPYFKQIGTKYITMQSKLFGPTDHIYNCDTYNEMDPPTNDTAYLANASLAVLEAMRGGDPEAIWLMQGWLFVSTPNGFWKPAQIQAYLGSIPNNSMWILDLAAVSAPVWSRTNAFYGKPFIFCSLLNYGGQQGLAGNMNGVVEGIEKAIENENMMGVGITMEGIWQNYPFYELTLQQTWKPESKWDLNSWITRYGVRRYGQPVDSVVSAWQMLGSSIYNGQGGGFGSAISGFPNIKGPQDPNPPAPPGFTRYHPEDGYWKNIDAQGRKSVNDCGAVCLNYSNCLAFEVYVDTPPDFGNCYIFLDKLEQPFYPLSPCRTYVRNKSTAPTAYKALYKQGPDMKMASTFGEVWSLLLKAKDQLAFVESYHFDLVDVAREVIAANFSATLAEFQKQFLNNNTDQVVKLGDMMLHIIDDYDMLLSCDTNFMLGRWQKWSRSWAQTEAEANWLEFNGRNQLTLWGPTGQINDYAKKEWGGLVRSYYKKRWELAVEMVVACLKAPGGCTWHESQLSSAIFNKVELPWQNDTSPFPVFPQYDLIQTAVLLFDKYVSQTL